MSALSERLRATGPPVWRGRRRNLGVPLGIALERFHRHVTCRIKGHDWGHCGLPLAAFPGTCKRCVTWSWAAGHPTQEDPDDRA